MPKLALAFDILANDAQARRALDRVGDHSEKTGRRVSHSFGKLAGAITGAFAGVGAVHLFKGMIADAEESRKVTRLTEQVIKTTGKAAHVSARQVGELATAISNKTGIDDEAIQSGSNLLLTFTGIRNEVGKGNRIFDQATAIITDMSVALGTDVKASAIQVGKALNDPIKGVTALTKVGVSFTKQQREQIKTLVESGHTLDAQKVILAELGREFGGAAAAASTPMDKLRVTLGNLSEELGAKLLPYIDRFANFMLTEAVPAVEGFLHGMRDGVGAGGKFADVIGDLGDQAKSAWGVVKPFFGFIGDHPKLFTEIAKDAAILAVAMKGIGAVKKLPGLGSLLGGGKGGLLGGISAAKPLPVFVTNPGFGAGTPGGKGSPKIIPPIVRTGAKALLPRALGTAGLIALTSGDAAGPKAFTGIKKALVDVANQAHLSGDALKEFYKAAGFKQNASREQNQRSAVDKVAALAFLQKYGHASAQAQAAIRELVKDPQVAAALKKQAQNAANNVRLISGGLLKVTDLSTHTGASIATNLGGGIGKAKERADALRDSIARIPGAHPKIDLDSAAADRKALLFSRRLAGIKGKDVTLRASVITSGRSLKIAEVHSSGGTMYIQGTGGKLLLAEGGWANGRGTSRSDSIPAMLSNGEFVTNARAAKKYGPQLEAMNAGRAVPATTAGFSMGDVHITVADNKTALSVPNQLREMAFLAGHS